MSEMRWNDAEADQSQSTDEDPGICARCKRPGSLYDGEFPRAEGLVCWVCVDNEIHDDDDFPADGSSISQGIVLPKEDS